MFNKHFVHSLKYEAGIPFEVVREYGKLFCFLETTLRQRLIEEFN